MSFIVADTAEILEVEGFRPEHGSKRHLIDEFGNRVHLIEEPDLLRVEIEWAAGDTVETLHLMYAGGATRIANVILTMTNPPEDDAELF